MSIHFMKKLPIQNTLFISYFTLIFFITMIAGGIFYYISSDMTIDQINNYTFIMLNDVNKRVDGIISSTVDMGLYMRNDVDMKLNLRGFPNKDTLGQLDTESNIKDIISSYLRDKPDIFNVSILVPGQKIFTSGKNSIYPLEDVQNSSWFKKIEGVDSILLEPEKFTRPNLGIQVTDAINLYMITMISRMKDYNNADIGYLIVDVNTLDLYSQLEKSKASKDSVIYIINNKGSVIVSDNNAGIGNPLPYDVSGMLQRSSGEYLRTKYQGADSLLICSDANSQGWRIVEFIPVSELYTGLERLQIIPIIIILVSLLLAFPLSLFLSGYITKPIIHLASIMLKFKATNTSEKVSTDFSNEIGTLYTSYNTMLDRIESLLTDIQNANNLKRKSDLKMLQAQINPHFLYNTLDSISWNALGKGIPDISEMVSMLSKFFRLSLNGGNSICTVQDELEQVKYFMDIEKICFNNTFDFDCNLEEGTGELLVPKLILQPLVENSIKHGFERKKGSGLIKLRVYTASAKLFIEVEDNGKGIDSVYLQELLSVDNKMPGIGVKNVNDRIAFICGKEYGLSFSQVETGGTLVRITLPIATHISAYANY